MAHAAGQPLTTLAVAWILANPAITSVILGASRADQLTATLAAADHVLPDDLKSALDDVSVEYRRGDAIR
jgi:aryl-alcohol dehydrogenase-like predicted oxidoreductase